jgi:hypothetical protein
MASLWTLKSSCKFALRCNDGLTLPAHFEIAKNSMFSAQLTDEE